MSDMSGSERQKSVKLLIELSGSTISNISAGSTIAEASAEAIVATVLAIKLNSLYRVQFSGTARELSAVSLLVNLL